MFKRITIGFLIALFSISGVVLSSAEVLAQSRGGWSSRPTYTPPPPPPRVYQPPAAPRQVPVPPAGVSSYSSGTRGINTGPGIRPQPGANPQRGLLGGTRQPPSANPQGAGQLGKQGSSRQNLMSGTAISTGVVKAPRNPTPSEIQKGFIGRVTADGRALVKFQNRILAVPATRISGLSARLAKDNERKTSSTAQQQSAINSRIKAVAAKGAAANIAAHEAYKDGLRGAMSKPAVSDSALARLIDPLYRPNATVGSGSTAAAIRQELATGQPVGGAFHSQKAADSIRALERWLSNNPTARPGDRAAAENVIRDMSNALGGR